MCFFLRSSEGSPQPYFRIFSSVKEYYDIDDVKQDSRLHHISSRLRRAHLDNLSFVSNIASTTTSIQNFNKSFFFRSHTLWNSLPFDIKNSMRLSQFKIKLAKHFWSIALSDNEQPEHEWSFQSSDEVG